MTAHNMVSMIEVPEAILASCDPSVRGRRTVEYRIVHRVITDLLAAGFTLHIDHEGEDEDIAITSDVEPMAEMFACDEERLYVRKNSKKAGWVMFIYGNDGWDVISDYTTNLEDALKGSCEYANTFGG